MRAQQLSQQAARILYDSPTEAEELLREALAAALFFGPAHNNLGVLYLHADRLYEAASEFEWARKLLPGHPDPRMNLALTLEKAGQVTGAIESYESALEVYPGHIPTEQALARLLVSEGTQENRAMQLLESIALRGESEEWRQWAQNNRNTRPK